MKDMRRISVISPSDPYKTRLLWGDHWVKYELVRAFREIGYIITDEKPNIVIHLFGSPHNLPENVYSIGWIYSHPDKIKPRILKQYDKIFCLSSSFTEKIRKMGFEAELMIGATAKQPVQKKIEYDILSVSNWRRMSGGRKVIHDLGETSYNLKIWGTRWKGKIPQKYYGGEYHDNQKLNELYASSLITLVDCHADMAREGFVPVKIFDALASGGFCISDKNSGIEEIFGNSIPQYKSPDHLKELVKFYINYPDERLRLMEMGRKIALSHTWEKRAKQFLGIES